MKGFTVLLDFLVGIFTSDAMLLFVMIMGIVAILLSLAAAFCQIMVVYYRYRERHDHDLPYRR